MRLQRAATTRMPRGRPAGSEQPSKASEPSLAGKSLSRRGEATRIISHEKRVSIVRAIDSARIAQAVERHHHVTALAVGRFPYCSVRVTTSHGAIYAMLQADLARLDSHGRAFVACGLNQVTSNCQRQEQERAREVCQARAEPFAR